MFERIVHRVIRAGRERGKEKPCAAKPVRSAHRPASRAMAAALAVCLMFTLAPVPAFASEAGGYPCGHVHDEECGYIEAVEGAPCSHLNEDGTYSCTPVLDSGVSGNATPSDADYVCDHSDGCGYAEAVEGADCTHSCELCDPTVENPPVETPPDKDAIVTDTCICDALCTEGVINPDCPICSAEGADLTKCVGTEQEKSLSYNEVVALFTALPSADSITDETTEEEKAEITAQITAALDAFEALSDEDFAKFSEEHSDLLAAVRALQTALINDTPTPLVDNVVTVLQSDGTTERGQYTTLADAIAAAQSGDTLKITAAIDLGTTGVTIDGKSLTLDLSGQTITYSGTSANAIMLIYGASLTVTDGGTGGKLSATGSSGYAINNKSTGTVTVEGGTVSTTNSNTICNNAGGTITVTGGTVEATGSSGYYPIYNNSTGTITVTGGTVSATNGDAINNGGRGAVNLSGGTVSATGSSGTAIYTSGTGKITISGDATVTSANTNADMGTIHIVAVPQNAPKTVLEITGGTVENTASNGYSVYFAASDVTSANLSSYYTHTGGTVGRVHPEAAAAVEITKNGTTTKYATLADAISAAQSGDTLKITAGIDLGTTGVEISGKSLTLDLNGQTITYSGTSGAIELKNAAGLTVTDGGTGGNLEATASVGVAIGNASTGAVTVKGGTVSAAGSAGNAIYNASTGAVTVTGGTVSATNTNGVAIYNNSTGKITISGNAKVTGANTSASWGTIFIAAVPRNDPKTVLEIKDTAKVENTATDGYAVYFSDSTGVTSENLSDYYTAASTATVGKVHPEAASTTPTPTVEGKNIYANGAALIIDGTSKTSTTIYVDADRDGVLDEEDKSLHALGIDNAPADGSDLSTGGWIVYGGSHNANLEGDTKITMLGGYVTSLRGGGYAGTDSASASANVTGSASIRAVGGEVGGIYGGGGANAENTAANVGGGTSVVIGDSAKVNAVYGGGTAYVSGAEANVAGTAAVTVTGGRITTLYGGGVAFGGTATVGATNVSISGGTLNSSTIGGVYGGGLAYGAATATANVTGTATVSVSGNAAVDADIYGGGYSQISGASASVNGAATVSVSDSAAVSGSVYGGGRSKVAGAIAAVGGNSSVTVGGNAKIGGEGKGVVLNGGTGDSEVTNGVASFQIDPDLTNTGSVSVVLPTGIAVGTAIATGAAAGDAAKIHLTGPGATGLEAYFDSGSVKLRQAVDVYSVVGGFTGWEHGVTGYDLEETESPGVYQAVLTPALLGVEDEAKQQVEFKVVKNHSWDTNWGDTGPGGANFKADLPQGAFLEVTLDLNANGGKGSASFRVFAPSSGGTIGSGTTAETVKGYFGADGAAVTVADSTGVITLQKDVILSATVNFKDTVRAWTLDLNGHTLTGALASSVCVQVGRNAALTLADSADNGTISNEKRAALAVMDGAKLTVEGGVLRGGWDNFPDDNRFPIHTFPALQINCGGDVTLRGGVFRAGVHGQQMNYGILVNANFSDLTGPDYPDTTLTFDPGEAGIESDGIRIQARYTELAARSSLLTGLRYSTQREDESWSPSALAVDNRLFRPQGGSNDPANLDDNIRLYSNLTAEYSGADGGGWTKTETLAQALDAVSDGGTVRLLLDAPSPTLSVDKKITLDLNGKTLGDPQGRMALVLDSGANLTVTDGVGGGKILGGNATNDTSAACAVSVEGASSLTLTGSKPFTLQGGSGFDNATDENALKGARGVDMRAAIGGSLTVSGTGAIQILGGSGGSVESSETLTGSQLAGGHGVYVEQPQTTVTVSNPNALIRGGDGGGAEKLSGLSGATGGHGVNLVQGTLTVTAGTFRGGDGGALTTSGNYAGTGGDGVNAQGTVRVTGGSFLGGAGGTGSGSVQGGNGGNGFSLIWGTAAAPFDHVTCTGGDGGAGSPVGHRGYGLYVRGADFTVNGGAFTGGIALYAAGGENDTFRWVVNGGVLNGDINGLQTDSVGGSTVFVTGGAFTGGKAGASIRGSGEFSGGTFTGSGEDAYAVVNTTSGGTVLALLAPGKAYFTDGGQQLTPGDEAKLGQNATLRVANTGSTPAPLYSISGKVSHELTSATTISGHIRLLQNGVVLQERVLSGGTNGTPYTFTGVAPGVYTLVAVTTTGGESGKLEQTATILVTVVDQDLPDVDLGWKTGGVGSEVVVEAGTPPVAVGGLNEIAAGYGSTGDGKGYGVVRLTAEAEDEPADGGAIIAVAGGKTLEYLDLSLKFIQTNGDEIDLGGGNTVVLELVLPYDFTNRRNVTVYRHHDSAATALTALSGAPDVPADGAFWADPANGYIHIYASKFSTYAIGYTTPSSGGGGGGGGTSSYTITATAGAGGTISPSGKVSVTRNGDKTFTIEPDEGYTVADVLVDGKSVGAVERYTFEKVAEAHTIAASFRKADKAAWNPFADVKEGAWYYDSVKYVYEHDLMNGTGNTTFSPDLSTTRGMIVTILWRLEQEPDSGAAMAFTDVKAGSYCYEAVRWAAEHEIVKGYTAATFGPDHTITRQELAAILYRYAQYKGMDVSASDDLAAFTDRPDAWAEDAVKWAVEQGIITGKGGGILDPKGEATRAQVAAMLMRFINTNIK